MFLQILATIDSAAAAETRAIVSAHRLSALTGLAVTPAACDGLPAFRFAVAGGSAGDFLGDKSIEDGAEWTFDPEYLSALASAVTALSRECPRFSFVARWFDATPPRALQRISAAALAALVRDNRVGNNVLYVVS